MNYILSFLADAPLFVYVHGGYWQALDRTISSYCVAPQVKAGNIVAIVGYELAPKGLILILKNVKSQCRTFYFLVELKEIIAEVQTAMSALLKWAAERGSK